MNAFFFSQEMSASETVQFSTCEYCVSRNLLVVESAVSSDSRRRFMEKITALHSLFITVEYAFFN